VAHDAFLLLGRYSTADLHPAILSETVVILPIAAVEQPATSSCTGRCPINADIIGRMVPLRTQTLTFLILPAIASASRTSTLHIPGTLTISRKTSPRSGSNSQKCEARQASEKIILFIRMAGRSRLMEMTCRDIPRRTRHAAVACSCSGFAIDESVFIGGNLSRHSRRRIRNQHDAGHRTGTFVVMDKAEDFVALTVEDRDSESLDGGRRGRFRLAGAGPPSRRRQRQRRQCDAAKAHWFLTGQQPVCCG